MEWPHVGGSDLIANSLQFLKSRRVELRRNDFKMNVDHEVQLLQKEIRRLGNKNAEGQYVVKFGVLFSDDDCANLFEALVGTLKAAKKRKIVAYKSELLLQGVHDDVEIVLLGD